MGIFSSIFGGTTAVSTAEAKARIDSEEPPYLLDVREPYEFKDGHIPGARLVPLGDLARRMSDLPKDREILVICRSGNRSGRATKQLTQAGLNAVNLSGGMIGWQRAGFPIRKGSKQ
ncbi:MAG: rhodanese-like domain-containing protein [Chloroflexota bacterium]